jgi:hypothetical protein
MTHKLHSFKELNSVQMGYVTKVIGNDFTGYGLDVKSRPAQFVAIPLLQFDVYYCAHEFFTIPKIKRHSLINLLY